MNRQEKHNELEQAMEVLNAKGFDGMGSAIQILFNLELNIPQVRDGDFYPACLEKGMRSERALRISLAEMYVQGVSTRKVTTIT